mmetsp:Transcript_24440/g.43370  ORF Transcript_24440/g.43370 Transcript_24440/m.43370 type:complete len:200 (-) Transcript_24440:166-765(-)
MNFSSVSSIASMEVLIDGEHLVRMVRDELCDGIANMNEPNEFLTFIKHWGCSNALIDENSRDFPNTVTRRDCDKLGLWCHDVSHIHRCDVSSVGRQCFSDNIALRHDSHYIRHILRVTSDNGPACLAPSHDLSHVLRACARLHSRPVGCVYDLLCECRRPGLPVGGKKFFFGNYPVRIQIDSVERLIDPLPFHLVGIAA